MDKPDRNPLVFPDPPSAPVGGCPVCHGKDYGGQLNYGVVVFKCRTCGNEWQGGIGQQPQDPTVPAPPQDPRSGPMFEFAIDKRERHPVPVQVRAPSLVPDFRKGLPEDPGDQ